MSKRYLILFLLITTIPVIIFVGCDLSGTTIEGRIDSFIYNINYDRSDTYTNFHPVKTDLYDNLKLSDWESLFPSANIEYYVLNLDTSDSNNVTGVIHCTETTEWPKDVIFVMAKDGLSWYIDDMYLGTGPNPVIY